MDKWSDLLATLDRQFSVPQWVLSEFGISGRGLLETADQARNRQMAALRGKLL